MAVEEGAGAAEGAEGSAGRGGRETPRCRSAIFEACVRFMGLAVMNAKIDMRPVVGALSLCSALELCAL